MIFFEHDDKTGNELYREVRRCIARFGACYPSVKGPVMYLNHSFEIGRDSVNGAGAFDGTSSKRQILRGLYEAMSEAQGEYR